MYEREIPARANRRRRSRRRKKSPMPAIALVVAAVAFITALKMPQDAPDEPQNAAAIPVTAISASGDLNDTGSSGLLPDPRGAEPSLPGAAVPYVDKDSWELLLVNPWNPLPEDYTLTLKELYNGHAVDERCYDELTAMLDACKADGLSPLVCSSYRSQSKQEALYENKVERLVSQGWSREDAKVEAAKVVALPGTSEHQLGLAVDIVDLNHQLLDESQESTDVQQWLIAHSWEYGFILRYPNDKSEITGIIYEPWHYRYVGKDAAKEIHDAGVCLEEYLGAA